MKAKRPRKSPQTFNLQSQCGVFRKRCFAREELHFVTRLRVPQRFFLKPAFGSISVKTIGDRNSGVESQKAPACLIHVPEYVRLIEQWQM